jgi:hypothetical protein
VGADGLDRLKRAFAREHDQAAEERLLVLAQEVVAPVDRGAQRALAWVEVACAAREELQLVVQAGEQRLLGAGA